MATSGGKPVEVVDNEALIAMSAVVGALREVLVDKKLLTDAEVDTAIRRTIGFAPFDAETKRRILFLALGPGGDIEVVQH